MTTKHYALIVGVLIIVLLGVFLVISKKDSDIVIENPNDQNVLFIEREVSTTTITSSSSTPPNVGTSTASSSASGTLKVR